MTENALIKNLYDLNETLAKDYLLQFNYPWEALPGIGGLITELSSKLDMSVFEDKGDGVFIARSAKIWNYSTIVGPCIIGENTEVRPGAFIRGKALIGNDCVVGNSTELKNVILFNHVQVPHYNYVGDSILGFYSHMGAGSITSNVKSDKKNVVVKFPDGELIETGLKKFGAMLGDHVEVGCNSVLNPGTVVGRNTNIYPTSCVRGVINADSVFKDRDRIVKKED
ncbi:MAG: UDP-N-acetylglucosamine pyrophosphorylase [Lachnospiraceae bacterium]|nr:UDP-N-acetylglucosamine pyrophosphorylase [Lachnospiraceae bacterium]